MTISKTIKPVAMYVTGEINSELFNKFSRRLRKYETEGIKRLNLELISEGGDAYAALAFHDRIQRTPVEISVTATGLVASAATLVFISCRRRFMTQNAWLMVHEDTISGLDDLKVSQIEKEARHARRLEDQWVQLFVNSTSIQHNYWNEVNKEETYMTAQECLDLGIIEAIV